MTGKLLRGSAVVSVSFALLLAAGGVTKAALGEPPALPQPAADGVSDPLSAVLPTVQAEPPPRGGTAFEPGSATATGVGVAPLGVCIACTSAGSKPGSEHAAATAVRVLGADISSGRSEHNGAHSGALLAVPANPLLGIALAQWAAESRANGASHSKSALVAIVILPSGHDEGGTATICVVDTSSDSDTKGDKGKKAKSSGEAADADVANGTAAAQLAHSDASDGGDGKAYVVGVNKNELISSDQSKEGLPVKIPGADVVVVHKQASDADTEAAVAAAEAQPASAPSQSAATADVVMASAASPATPTTQPPATVVQTPPTGAVAPSTGTGGAVVTPTTGTALGLGGLLLVLDGAAVTVLSLRRRRVPG